VQTERLLQLVNAETKSIDEKRASAEKIIKFQMWPLKFSFFFVENPALRKIIRCK